MFDNTWDISIHIYLIDSDKITTAKVQNGLSIHIYKNVRNIIRTREYILWKDLLPCLVLARIINERMHVLSYINKYIIKSLYVQHNKYTLRY